VCLSCHKHIDKLEFHGTDTDIHADFRARMSACPACGDFPVQLATSWTRMTILADLSADLSDTCAFPREDVR